MLSCITHHHVSQALHAVPYPKVCIACLTLSSVGRSSTRGGDLLQFHSVHQYWVLLISTGCSHPCLQTQQL